MTSFLQKLRTICIKKEFLQYEKNHASTFFFELNFSCVDTLMLGFFYK